MFNLSDKELDRLSREAADAYEVETNTSSWDALEKRLDQELGTAPKPNVPPPRRFIFPIAYTSLIILLVSSGYFLLKSGKKSSTENKTNYTFNNIENKKSADSSSHVKVTASISEKKNDAAINSAPDKNESTTNDKKNNHVSSTNTPNDEKTYLAHLKSIAEKESEKKNGKTVNKKEIDNLSTSNSNERFNGSSASNQNNHVNNKNPKNDRDRKRTSEDELKNIAANEANSSDVPKNSHSNYAASKEKNNFAAADNQINSIDNTKDLNNTAHTNNQEEEDLKYASLQGTVFAAKHHAIIISDSGMLAEASKLQNEINLLKKNKSLNINRSLQIGLSFAPDFSKVKYVYQNYHIGTGFGVTLGYQLFHKLSVNTGITYANKYYQADGNDFHEPQQRLNAALVNEHIDFVRGSFKMIEMPLNLRYDFGSDGSTIFFVSGGFSSYFLLSQSNSYYCHDYVGYQRWIIQNYNQNQNYWFSMANLSVGFETFLSNNISLQIDPYVKIPLRGVGVGNMQLSSYGINLGIKYSPVLKRSRH